MPPVFQSYLCPVCGEDAVDEWFAAKGTWQRLDRPDLEWKRAICPNGHEPPAGQLDRLQIGPNFPPR
jgi:hypothetical protein